MTTDDPNYSYLLRRLEALEQLLLANPLRAASVSRGVTEFRDDSTLLITDSNMRVVGVAYVVGRLEGEGALAWSGNVFLDGPVEITDTLDVLAQTRLRGETTIEGLAKLLSELIVEGKITAGNVVVEKDRIIIGGEEPATLENGEFTLGNGAKVQAGLTGGTSSIGLVPEGGVVDISANQFTAWLRAVGATIAVSTSQARIDATIVTIDQLPVADSIDNLEWVARDIDSGRLYRVPPGVGGPGGDFEWPYDLGLVTSEFGVRVHPVTGETTMHNGIDFGPPAGTPIPSIGSGTVTTSQNSGGFGNLVVVDHGTVGGAHVESYYAHMQAPGAAVGASVGTGDILGNVGSTGLSTGPHLHMEIHVDGVPVNPRDFMAQFGG